MTLSATIQGFLSAGDFEAIESDWLSHISDAPADVAYFVELAEALAGEGHGDRGKVLLDLLDEELRQQGLWRVRLDLLRRGAHLWLAPGEVHAAILHTVRRTYATNPHFDALVEIVRLDRGGDDLHKTWHKVFRLGTLLAFEVGAIVFMEGKGVGRVVDVNLKLQNFKIEFENHPPLTTGFAVAGKLVTVLPAGHILRRKLEEPDALIALRDGDPAELLRLTLTSYDRPLTGVDVRQALAGIVPDGKWSSWWTAARKHPQVVATTGSRQSYRWADTSQGAREAVWQDFESADPRGKLELLRRSGHQDPGLRDRMVGALSQLAAATVAENPGLVFEIGSALERSGDLEADAGWAPREVVRGISDPAKFLSGLRSRTVRETAYTMVNELRPDWVHVYRDALWLEEDPRLLQHLGDALREASPSDYEEFVDQTLGQPRRAPAAFTWLAERAADDAELRERRAARLCKQILAVMASSDFASFRGRLKSLCDSGGSLPRLLSHLSDEQAADVDEALERSPGVEGYQRESLRNALHLRFPELRKERQASLYATAPAVDARRAELKALLEEEIPANRKAIGDARALGDLRENFEYKAARQRHEYLSARVSALQEDLARVQVLEPTRIDVSEVRVGTAVDLIGPNDTKRTLTILGPWESRPEEDIVSYQSELAQELLGRRVGESVEISGEAFEITGIKTYEEGSS